MQRWFIEDMWRASVRYKKVYNKSDPLNSLNGNEFDNEYTVKWYLRVVFYDRTFYVRVFVNDEIVKRQLKLYFIHKESTFMYERGIL